MTPVVCAPLRRIRPEPSEAIHHSTVSLGPPITPSRCFTYTYSPGPGAVAGCAAAILAAALRTLRAVAGSPPPGRTGTSPVRATITAAAAAAAAPRSPTRRAPLGEWAAARRSATG